MKKISLFTIAAISAMALVGCDSGANTANTNVRTNANALSNNSNVIIVTNTNNMETGTMNTNSKYNANITEAEVEKDKDRYENDAKQAGSKIGTGAKDLWLWTKTRAALAAAEDLRDSTINVDVENAAVTLRGTVGTAAQKASAEKVAKGIEGVSSVKNSLTVSAGDSLTNQATTDGDKKTTNSNANR
jgi:osmotically-inducible protein OsmY